jgi:hypothetical protein
MELSDLARLLALFGVTLLVIAGGLYLFSRFDLPLGKLPGDIVIKRENFTCFFPIVSSIVLSLLLTLVINLIARILQK